MSINWSAVGAVATGLAASATTLAAVAANRGLTLARKSVDSSATSSNLDRRMYGDALVTNFILAEKEFCFATIPYTSESGQENLLDDSSPEKMRLARAAEEVRSRLDMLELAGLHSIGNMYDGGIRMEVTAKVIELGNRILYHIIIYCLELIGSDEEIFDDLLKEQKKTLHDLWVHEGENGTEVIDRLKVLFHDSIEGRTTIQRPWTKKNAQQIFSYLLDTALTDFIREYKEFADALAPWLPEEEVTRIKKLINWVEEKFNSWFNDRKLIKWFYRTKLINWIDNEL